MLRFSNAVNFVDTEIAGEVIRVIIDGLPRLRAITPQQALQELRAEHDAFRRFILEPPRGHGDVNAALLLPPFTMGSVRTLVVAAQFGFAPLAGTPLLASSVVMVETGVVPASRMRFDTASGPTHVVPHLEDGRCRSARWRTTPPTIALRNHSLALDNGRSVSVNLIVAGLPYLVVGESTLGVTSSDIQTIGSFGARISRAAGQSLPMEKFGVSDLTADYPVLVIGEPKHVLGDGAHVPLAWVYANGIVAKMPAGTGALSAAAFLTDLGLTACGTIITANSPFGGKIRSAVGEPGQSYSSATTAMVEANVEVVSIGELVSE